MNKIKKINFFYVLAIIICIFMWEICVFIKKDSSFPHFYFILESFIQVVFSIDFFKNTFSTLKIVFVGCILSFTVAFFIGLLSVINNFLNKALYPIINFLKNIPSLSLYPVLILFFGISDLSRIFIIFWTSFFPVYIETVYSLNSIEKNIIEAGNICGTNKIQNIIFIRLPLSIIGILNGFRISISNGFVSVIVAEMLGATKGLGYMVVWNTNVFNYSEMYAYIIIIGLIGLFFELVINKIIIKYKECLL